MPELNWCGEPIGPGQSYGGKEEFISGTWGKKPALAAAKQHQHFAVITEADLAEVFGHGNYSLPRAEAAKLLEARAKELFLPRRGGSKVVRLELCFTKKDDEAQSDFGVLQCDEVTAEILPPAIQFNP
jgi:hypothetical protein